MFATRSTLQELSGRQRRKAVVDWLEETDLPFMLDADGWPKVLQVVLDERLGVGGKVPSPSEPRLRL